MCPEPGRLRFEISPLTQMSHRIGSPSSRPLMWLAIWLTVRLCIRLPLGRGLPALPPELGNSIGGCAPAPLDPGEDKPPSRYVFTRSTYSPLLVSTLSTFP